MPQIGDKKNKKLKKRIAYPIDVLASRGVKFVRNKTFKNVCKKQEKKKKK